MSNKRREYTFFWFIENFSYCWHRKGESLISPVFTANGLEGTAWTLKLHPFVKHLGEDCIYIRLSRNEDFGPDLFVMNYNLSIVAENGSAISSKRFTINFPKKFNGCGWSFPNSVENLQQLGYLPKDILTVRCKLWNGEGNADTVAPILGRTRIGIEHISFLQEVESFSAEEPNIKPVQIRSRTKKECVVSSSLHFTGGIYCEKKIVLEIKLSGNDLIFAKCKTSLLDISGNTTKCAEVDSRFDVERKDIAELELSVTKDAIMTRKSEYLPGDKLSLLCDCTFLTGIEFQQIEETQNEITTTGKKLRDSNISTEKLAVCPSVVDDLKDIYSSKFLTDVVLKTKTNSFPAHKTVLCARSPVFKVMMSNDMKEKNSNSIQVDDLEDDTVQQLLLFIYSDNVEDLQWETATKLYYASDKYQIEKLRLMCSSFFMDNLTPSTAIELLLLADTHSDSDLQKFVEDFILNHEEQVFGSDEWEKLMNANPELALKTMHLKYKTKKKVGK
ncbi:Speckle-type POZ protein [Araneus ventricosus]|uniref:Speckle-type POZ protein n=1 Tax=Araneus ventricosus TaxID=182803 RepID=A0A4Y2V9S3_ARAVE|nr:Speckle-type POZ protein [Araneus ventricosus]